jgi:hypothetical protein
MYRFGTRDLVALPGSQPGLAGAAKHGGVESKHVTAANRLEQLCHGGPADSELILAGIERKLDVCRERDSYGQWLESWRNFGPNGEESFYEALDRTAGTNEEVFFYDSMLGDFVQRFALEEGKRWGTSERHDRNQSSFLAYRQYRGMIEAVAFALVLPPNVPFPRRLMRCDHGQVGTGQYAVRDQVDFMLLDAGGDAALVVEKIAGVLRANPPPPKIWERYEPLTALHQQFQAMLPDLVTRLKVSKDTKLSTDEILATARTRRQAIADAVRGVALAP